MNHEQIRDVLSDYLDDALTSAEMSEVEEHLAGCPGCAEELASYRLADHALRAQRILPTTAETEIAVRTVLLSLAPEPEVAWIGRIRSSPRWALPAFAAAFAAVVIAFGARRSAYSPSEALLYSQDDGRTYDLLVEAPSVAAASALGMEVR